MLNTRGKKEILKRLHFIGGQLRGIEEMIENDRQLHDIYAQLRAVEKGINKAIYVVFEEQVKKHLAEVLSKRLADCPGDCSDAERPRYTREQFAKLDLKEIIESIECLKKSGVNSELLKNNREKGGE